MSIVNYLSFVNLKLDEPYTRRSLVDIFNPLVFCDSSRLPRFNGSMLGISNSGTPFKRIG